MSDDFDIEYQLYLEEKELAAIDPNYCPMCLNWRVLYDDRGNTEACLECDEYTITRQRSLLSKFVSVLVIGPGPKGVFMYTWKIYLERADTNEEVQELGVIEAATQMQALHQAAEFYEIPSHDLLASRITETEE